MARRSEREITATLLRKIADNIDLLNESQARTLRTEIESKFRIFSIFEGNGKTAVEAIKDKKPGRPSPESQNFFIPDLPKGFETKLKRLINKRSKEREWEKKQTWLLPNFYIGLKELGYIKNKVTLREFYNKLKPWVRSEVEIGSESQFYNIVREISRNKERLKRNKEYYSNLILEALK